ncbi:hypothetical protein [Thiothrix winogradskyi]|uniref:Limiting CO2-inducible protein B/C beta carbonyic anhydrase domain-containing protein n=1 Tax=Thiothrix winogradskyi TaxID=96472 RepID=A0ABY3SZM8_9GAMM|nr:hypothetical protein [Thiothrix winogradskyi]UJS24603.1 hypothetical protein L2Y54_00820 [Thiothrix winogradskyi]
MYNVHQNVQASLGHFRMEDYWFRYSSFVPRLYNWCLDLGFEPGKIMPSRAFCSDESQGYPIILLAKHFGTFPFNHGQVGGIMACDRHGPHAHHGKDLVIVHASHVGYDPETYTFGTYRRIQSVNHRCSSNCGKIHATINWYLNEYEFACRNITVDMRADHCRVTLDNQYLSRSRERSLVLHLEKIVEHNLDGEVIPLSIQSTSRTFMATQTFCQHMSWFFKAGERQPIGDALLPEYFTFHTSLREDVDGSRQLEQNLIGAMPWIVTSAEPMLTAAQANTQAEFDRAYRSISQDKNYRGRNLVYLAGLHVDISPSPEQTFVLTKFIPWAAYVQLASGERYLLEQDALFAKLNACSSENPQQLPLDDAIHMMEEEEEIYLHLPY